jgi:hypothetical protein
MSRCECSTLSTTATAYGSSGHALLSRRAGEHNAFCTPDRTECNKAFELTSTCLSTRSPSLAGPPHGGVIVLDEPKKTTVFSFRVAAAMVARFVGGGRDAASVVVQQTPRPGESRRSDTFELSIWPTCDLRATSVGTADPMPSLSGKANVHT